MHRGRREARWTGVEGGTETGRRRVPSERALRRRRQHR